MRTQFQILFFFICLNLATWLVTNPLLSLPGTGYVAPLGGISPEEYESHYNATEIAKGWPSTPFTGIPVIGDIFSAFNMLVSLILYMFAGFPLFLSNVGRAYLTEDVMPIYNVIAGVLSGAFAVMMAWFFLEYISGRYVSD